MAWNWDWKHFLSLLLCKYFTSELNVLSVFVWFWLNFLCLSLSLSADMRSTGTAHYFSFLLNTSDYRILRMDEDHDRMYVGSKDYILSLDLHDINREPLIVRTSTKHSIYLLQFFFFLLFSFLFILIKKNWFVFYLLIINVFFYCCFIWLFIHLFA